MCFRSRRSWSMWSFRSVRTFKISFVGFQNIVRLRFIGNNGNIRTSCFLKVLQQECGWRCRCWAESDTDRLILRKNRGCEKKNAQNSHPTSFNQILPPNFAVSIASKSLPHCRDAAWALRGGVKARSLRAENATHYPVPTTHYSLRNSTGIGCLAGKTYPEIRHLMYFTHGPARLTLPSTRKNIFHPNAPFWTRGVLFSVAIKKLYGIGARTKHANHNFT
jgi:hypothetical protein